MYSYNYSNSISLIRSLTLSQLDAGLKDEASKTCTKAILLANKHVPSKLLDLVRLQVGVVRTGALMQCVFCIIG